MFLKKINTIKLNNITSKESVRICLGLALISFLGYKAHNFMNRLFYYRKKINNLYFNVEEMEENKEVILELNLIKDDLDSGVLKDYFVDLETGEIINPKEKLIKELKNKFKKNKINSNSSKKSEIKNYADKILDYKDQIDTKYIAGRKICVYS